MTEPVSHLQMTRLSCERQDRILFQNVSLQLGSGELARIHGRNGSGKSSLLKIATGLLKPASGQVFWNHIEISEQPTAYHRNLTYLGHKPAIKPELTVMENLKMLLGLRQQAFDQALTEQALDELSLVEYTNILAGYLSAGQQRRVALARLWLENTGLWVLDEPYTSLDKQAVGLVNARIDNALSNGAIVMMTSHQETTGLEVQAVNLYLDA